MKTDRVKESKQISAGTYVKKPYAMEQSGWQSKQSWESNQKFSCDKIIFYLVGSGPIAFLKPYAQKELDFQNDKEGDTQLSPNMSSYQFML